MDDVNAFFEIVPDWDLDLMRRHQALDDIVVGVLDGVRHVLESFKPDLVFVQGDTTTVVAAALACFHRRIAVAHVEAGLRTGDRWAPFPEEMNRRLMASLGTLHFAPTRAAMEALRREQVVDDVFVVGNTAIDALHQARSLLNARAAHAAENRFPFLDPRKRLLLVTAHRRESFGRGLEQICLALKDIVSDIGDVQIVYPVHLNPNVQAPVRRILGDVPGVFLIGPVDYGAMIELMDRATIVLTDSGGVQEEAPSLGKPVLVLRDKTERMEGVEAGLARLVGLDRDRIVYNTLTLLRDPVAYARMSQRTTLYGDGTAAPQIEAVVRGRRFEARADVGRPRVNRPGGVGDPADIGS